MINKNNVLIFPPMADPYQPYSALPALAAFLEQNALGYPLLMDLNIEFTRYLLTPEMMTRAVDELESRLEELDGLRRLNASENTQYGLIIDSLLKAPIVLPLLDEAVKTFKDMERFKQLSRLSEAKRIVHETLNIYSALSFPHRLSLSNSPTQLFPAFESLRYHAEEWLQNPYRRFYLEYTIPRLLQTIPQFIGISITYQGQILPAVTLAACLKEQLPQVPVVFGGNIISLWYDSQTLLEANSQPTEVKQKLSEVQEGIASPGVKGCPATQEFSLTQELTLNTNTEKKVPGRRRHQTETYSFLFKWCDYIIPFEGESALKSLIRFFRGDVSSDAVPNLVYPEGGKVIRNPIHIENINTLPVPDYRGLPLDLYLSPQPVFLLNTSRGCYWSRCRFCSVSSSMRMRGEYRMREPEKLLRDILAIVQRHGSPYIFFGDDCVSPLMLKKLVPILKKEKKKLATEGIASLASTEEGVSLAGMGKKPLIYWQCETRFEEELTTELIREMREAGCLNLIFGMETYSQELLDKMEKGIKRETIDRILNDCRENGIAFNLQFFFGFPGETEKDARVTVDFIKKQAYGAASFSFGLFDLLKESGVDKHPEQFSIDSIDRSAGPFAISYPFTPISSHAQRIKDELQDYLYKDSRYPYAGLSMNAHTLIFLSQVGVQGLAETFKKKESLTGSSPFPFEALNLKTGALIRGVNQSLGEFSFLPGDRKDSVSGEQDETSHLLLYDFDIDSTIEVSPVVAWVLRQMDGQKPTSEIIEALRYEIDDDIDVERVYSALYELLRRGFLRMDGGC